MSREAEPRLHTSFECEARITIQALDQLPSVEHGADLAAMIAAAIEASGVELREEDILSCSSKLVSRAEGRFVDLSEVAPSSPALDLAQSVEKDPRLVELILRESEAVSRAAAGVLVTRHRLGFISANAAIDASNAQPQGASKQSGPWVLLLPKDPDRSARELRIALEKHFGVRLAIIITDSHGRPFRQGSVGTAIGVSGIAPLIDHAGRKDRFGRELETTSTALADQIAAIADLVAGQSSENRPVSIIRGLHFVECEEPASTLVRSPESDLYA